MDVLLVIDMQQGLFTQPRHQDSQVIANINRLAERVRAEQGRVIYVQHDAPVPKWIPPVRAGSCTPIRPTGA